MNRLKIVEFDGKKWFVDFRLEEFRNVYNPHERVSFYKDSEEAIR
jgi:hypothetical protein